MSGSLLRDADHASTVVGAAGVPTPGAVPGEGASDARETSSVVVVRYAFPGMRRLAVDYSSLEVFSALSAVPHLEDIGHALPLDRDVWIEGLAAVGTRQNLR